jgi:ferric-dicitrate binding protein FerR (iron transport regulator)
MSFADRARAAHAAAEAATHPADRAAYRAAAAGWEALGRAGQTWSHEPAQRALASLQRALAAVSEAPQPALAAIVTLDDVFGTPVNPSSRKPAPARTAINPARVTPTGGRYHVTGAQPAAIEF